IRGVRPLVHAVVWPRWLYLERALESASQAGDLLFGALVLRTMAEEVGALRRLDRFERALMDRPGPVTAMALHSIRAHGDLLSARFLPLDPEQPTLTNAVDVEPLSAQEERELDAASKRLNDYVHPNYGSHLLALFPERSSAGRVLIDATISVLEHFFSLSW